MFLELIETIVTCPYVLERKGKSSMSGVVPHVCVLHSPGQVKKLDPESSASHSMRLLNNFCHIE